MITYVKKNNRLVPIGEGRLYTKKELLLREFGGETNNNNKITLTSDSPQKETADAHVTKAKQELPKIPGNNAYHIDAEKLYGATPKQNPMGTNQPRQSVTVSLKDPNLPQEVRTNAANGYDTNIEESVNRKRSIDEMRRNSIPFTKKEMTRFLKSI